MKKFFLTIFLMTPILAVASVLYIFAIGVNNPHKQIAHVPAVGAGAGKTGGANAVGELLFGHTATGETRLFDKVILATHAPTSLALLADPTPLEQELLPQVLEKLDAFAKVSKALRKLQEKRHAMALGEGDVTNANNKKYRCTHL